MKQSGRMKWIVLGVGVIGLVGWRMTHRAPSKKKAVIQETVAVPVETLRVKRSNMEDFLQLTGDIHGDLEAKVYAKVPGRLSKKVRDVGEAVRQGDVLFLVDRDEPAMQFALSEALSPLKGIVTRYFLDAGESISPAVAVCEVAALDAIRVVVHVIERDLVRVRPGLTARFTVDGYPGRVFQGRVVKISESLDSATRSADVELRSENASFQLKPGMFARVELVLAEHTGVVVLPRRAVRETGETASVFLVKNGKAVYRPVQLGIIQHDRVEVTSGVTDGDQVVIVGWQNLTDGMAVDVVSTAPAPAKR